MVTRIGLIVAVFTVHLVAQTNPSVTLSNARTGEVIRGLVLQKKDIAVTIVSGKTELVRFDGFEDGPEPFCYILPADGSFQVRVTDKSGDTESGHAPHLEPLHRATTSDDEFCRAVAESTKARKLHNESGPAAREQAVGHYSEAARRWNALAEPALEMRTLVYLATVQHATGQYEDAARRYEQALALARQLHERRPEGEALTGAGAAAFRLGEIGKALEYLIAALHIWRDTGWKEGEANALNNLGVFSYPIGEWQHSISYYLQAIDLVRASGNQRGEAYALNNLAVVYDSLGQPERAMHSLTESLRLFRATREKAAAGRTLGVMSRIALASQQPALAMKYGQEALEIARQETDRRTEAEIEQRLGEVDVVTGRFASAHDHFTRALAQFRQLANREGEAGVLHATGHLQAREGQRKAALNSLNAALQIRTAIGLRDRVAVTLADIATVEADGRDFESARQTLEKSLEIVETLRSRVPEATLRTSYFASRQEPYSFYIYLLMQLHHREPDKGYDALAFEAAERSRARTLLDRLSELEGQVRSGADPVLLDQERQLQREINLLSSQLLGVSTTRSTARESELRSRLEMKQTRLHELEMRMRTENPRYAALTQPRPMRVSEIQRELLDDDSFLLAYSLGKKASYLWVIERNRLQSFQLPGRTRIEGLITRLLQEAGNPRSQTADRISWELGSILLGPVESRIGRKRLLILADGALQSVPFAVLRVPRRNVPVIVDHEVALLPSASALALRRKTPEQTCDTQQILVLSDPVFDRQDPRVPPTSAPGPLLTRVQLTRLPFTREEAEAITGAVGTSRVRNASGFSASKAVLTSASSTCWRAIHIASHGIVDAADAQATGIVLSRVDAQGRWQDGFLRVPEIYNLNLLVDSVVLSACRSGLGKVVPGEGIAGITRAFLYAGAARVVSAQWDVDDQATAELMAKFYLYQFGKRRLRPAAALRTAQLDVLRCARWQSPYYWGAFVLQGEWR